MTEPHVISALKAKRAELTGRVQFLLTELSQTRADLLHIDASLRLFGYQSNPEGIAPTSRAPTSNLFDKGEIQHLIFDLLRASPDGLTTSVLADGIIVRKGFNPDDRHFRAALVSKLGGVLRKQWRRGKVTKGDKLRGRRMWRVHNTG